MTLLNQLYPVFPSHPHVFSIWKAVYINDYEYMLSNQTVQVQILTLLGITYTNSEMSLYLYHSHKVVVMIK